MSLYKIFGFAVLGLVLTVVLRRLKDEYAAFVSLFLCLGFTVCAIGILKPTVDVLRAYCGNADNADLFTLIFKACGIAFITTLAADLAAIAAKRLLPEKRSCAAKA